VCGSLSSCGLVVNLVDEGHIRGGFGLIGKAHSDQI